MSLKQIIIALLFGPTRATHVIAVTTAKGKKMITANAEQLQTSEAAKSEQPKATKKARAGAQRAHVAPTKAKSGKKATPGQKERPCANESPRAKENRPCQG